MTETMAPPPDWHFAVWPAGWDFDTDTWPSPDLERVGYTLLPRDFYLIMGFSDPDGEPSENDPAVIVTYEVVGGKVITREMHGLNADLADWFPQVGEFFPLKKWKEHAIAEMVKFLASERERKPVPDLVVSTPGNSQMLVELKRYRSPTAAPVKRHRITDQHLKEVVETYTEAVENGEPPTKAVAEKFGVAHSTAAKWVGSARRRDLLAGVSQKWGTK